MARDRREVVAVAVARMEVTSVRPVLHHDLWEQPGGRRQILKDSLCVEWGVCWARRGVLEYAAGRRGVLRVKIVWVGDYVPDTP